MTVKKAIKEIQNMIEGKQRIIKSEEELMKSWGPRPKDDSPTKTCKTLIEYLQYDIEMLRRIENQLKPKKDATK